MPKKRKAETVQKKDVLIALKQAFEEIDAFIDNNLPAVSADDHAEDLDEAQYIPISESVDRQEIEVGIDVFISDLVKRKLIDEPKPGTTPSLSDIFEELLGAGHRVIKTVKSFEEHIEGYFDMVSYEDLTKASGEASEILGILKDEAAKLQ